MVVTVQNDVQEIRLQVADHVRVQRKSLHRAQRRESIGYNRKGVCVVGYPEQVKETDPRRNQAQRGTQGPVCGPVRTLALPAG